MTHGTGHEGRISPQAGQESGDAGVLHRMDWVTQAKVKLDTPDLDFRAVLRQG